MMTVLLMMILIIQVGLLALGVYQVQQPPGLVQSVGVFNIIINLIGGGINLAILIKR